MGEQSEHARLHCLSGHMGRGGDKVTNHGEVQSLCLRTNQLYMKALKRVLQ